MATSVAPHVFWITSRAAGVLALVLSSLAVSLGLLMSTKLMSTKLLRRRAPDLLATHEVLSLAAIVAVVVHGAALLGDHYLDASLLDIAVPFAFSYQTLWTSLGIISGWGLALLATRILRTGPPPAQRPPRSRGNVRTVPGGGPLQARGVPNHEARELAAAPSPTGPAHG
ncbi:MAG: hypothetical protein ACRDNK_03985 [Solirubrobacteraceae bacterium]